MTTMNLPCVRFVKRVTNGVLGSKYSYLAMMAENAKALESAAWHESAVPLQNVTMPVNKVTETDAVYDESGAMTSPPSFSAFMSDGFDCFQQGGDARKEDGTMCGYAGCVAYRFKIPADAASVPLSSVSLAIQRDRYCRAGVRVALELSNSAAPSNNWSVVRGETSGAIVSESTASTVLGVSSWGFLSQKNVKNLVSGRAASSTITFNASGDGGFAALATTGMAYLWVYLTLEDYQSFWTMYNATDSRYYSIEGSAMLVASKAAFTFSDTVDEDSDDYVSCSGVEDAGYISLTQEEIATSKYGVTLEQDSAYGNLLHCTRTSAIFTFDDRGGFVNNLDAMPSKAMFSFETWPWGVSASNAPHFTPVPLSELGTLASVRMPFVDVSDTIDGTPTVIGKTRKYNTVNHHFFGFRLLRRSDDVGFYGPPASEGDVDPSSCKVYPVICAMWTYCAFAVPNGKNCYTKMNLEHLSSTISNGLVCDLLVWKSSSSSFFGAFAYAALAALAQRPAFFTGSQGRVEGTFVGDGSFGCSVSASATLLQRIPCSSMVHASPYTTTVDLQEAVTPGDVLIIVPSVRLATVSNPGGAADVSLDVSSGLYCNLA